MSGGSIKDNRNNGSQTAEGTGVYIAGTDAVFNMSGGEITGNQTGGTGGLGGGVCSNAAFNMSGDAVIKQNAASSKGGGVHLYNSGYINKTGGIIYGANGDGDANTAAASSGAAVYSVAPAAGPYNGQVKRRENTLGASDNLRKFWNNSASPAGADFEGDWE